METTKMTKAKRGDYAVCSKSSYISVIGGRGHQSLDITLGVVVSVTRDGIVKRVKPLSISCDMTERDWKEVLLIERGIVRNASGFEAECRARQCTSQENWNPFTSLDDVRETVRRFA